MLYRQIFICGSFFFLINIFCSYLSAFVFQKEPKPKVPKVPKPKVPKEPKVPKAKVPRAPKPKVPKEPKPKAVGKKTLKSENTGLVKAENETNNFQKHDVSFFSVDF